MDMLKIRGLAVHYPGPSLDRPVRAVDGLDLTVRQGETYALVGESGCGKSATGFAVVDLVDPGRITAGSIELQGENLRALNAKQMRAVRGGQVGLVFQEASAALNPVMKVGSQIAEVAKLHQGLSRKEAWKAAVLLLERVRLEDPERLASTYPHELSGGMRQRVMLAVALAGEPKLLIADEPTTALDVTVQAQILQLLRDLKRDLGLTVLFITHDLGVVAQTADRVGVMYAGRLVEEGPVGAMFQKPLHPYTRGLLDASPGRAPRRADRKLPAIVGAVPDPTELPSGCRFHPRCPDCFEPCNQSYPDGVTFGERRVACFLHSAERPVK